MTQKKKKEWCAGCQSYGCRFAHDFEEENAAMLLQGIMGMMCFVLLTVFAFVVAASMAMGG